ncbi:ShlB/FhaC/HecB family hemolysin secretion/activation protein [Sphingoaurantiacus capsulatus]|uniref:ShlB/FhaC/HecB family hemolysin secretion/activation protein n=1 Tax=Sphingoaurantiacus capsulatus TaxID=1771310 RepID=A0ABV7XBV0_9SPHN
MTLAPTFPARAPAPILAALLLAGVATPALAQTATPVPNQADISRQRVPQPLPETPQFDLRIQTPERAATPRAVDEIEFEVARIAVEGATRYPEAEVRAIFAPLEGRKIVLEELRTAANTLENRYRGDGYFLTRVFVPPQQVKDGVLTVRVVEGYIGNAFVESADEATRERLGKMIAPIVGVKPISLEALERRLLIINDLPGIAGNGVLRQGAELGQSELALAVTELPSSYSLSVNNTGSDSLGPWAFGANATLSRPFGRIGALDLGLAGAGDKLKELRSFNARYAEPIGSSGTVASLGGLVAVAKPGGVVKPLDLESFVTSFAARVRHPILRGRETSLFFDGGITANRSRTEAVGVRIILDKTVVAEAGLVLQQSSWLGGVTTASVSIFRGLPFLGSMDSDAALPSVVGFEPDFTRVTLSGTRLQPIANRFSALVGVQGQYTGDTLLSGEQIAFGGPSIGRGYDPSTVAGDRGLGGVIELRYDMKLPQQASVNSVQLYTFVDRARAQSLANGAQGKVGATVASWGLGARMALFSKAFVDVRFADATRSVAGAVPQRDPRVTVTGFIGF